VTSPAPDALKPGQATRSPTAVTVTVVVPTRNRGDLIGETVASLIALEDPGMEILVVDQSNDDATRRCVSSVAEGDPRVRVVPTPTVGSSAARNVGAQLATGELVAYTDDDCIVTKGWLTAIVEEFADSSVSAVFGRLVPYEGGTRTGREVGFKPNEARQVFTRKLPPWYIGHGGNMAFRRSALLAAGGFDPLLGAGGFFGACEDPDLAYRLVASAGKIVYSPRAEAYHKHWKDWRAQKRMERNYGIGAGAMFAKYVRCGDGYGARLAATWIWELGVRRVGSGLLKWRSLKTMYLGYCQLIYPWVGVARSLRMAVDPATMTYVI
jgi:GT2 family glycosyltransferase